MFQFFNLLVGHEEATFKSKKFTSKSIFLASFKARSSANTGSDSCLVSLLQLSKWLLIPLIRS